MIIKHETGSSPVEGRKRKEAENPVLGESSRGGGGQGRLAAEAPEGGLEAVKRVGGCLSL